MSRQQYSVLREILQLADLENINSLPKSLETLQRHYRGQLPLLVVWAKEVCKSR